MAKVVIVIDARTCITNTESLTTALSKQGMKAFNRVSGDDAQLLTNAFY